MSFDNWRELWSARSAGICQQTSHTSRVGTLQPAKIVQRGYRNTEGPAFAAAPYVRIATSRKLQGSCKALRLTPSPLLLFFLIYPISGHSSIRKQPGQERRSAFWDDTPADKQDSSFWRGRDDDICRPPILIFTLHSQRKKGSPLFPCKGACTVNAPLGNRRRLILLHLATSERVE